MNVLNIVSERTLVGHEKWLDGRLCNVQPIFGEPSKARGAFLTWLEQQGRDLTGLVPKMRDLDASAESAAGIALGALKSVGTDAEYQAFLCDGLAPKSGNADHGLRHALQVFCYALRIAQGELGAGELDRKIVHCLAWMAIFHDVACLDFRRNHAARSAGFAECLLRCVIRKGGLPAGTPLSDDDAKLVARGIMGHEKNLPKDDLIYGNDTILLAFRDADLLASTLHFDRFIRIHKHNLFFWSGWRFFDPSCNLEERLAILREGHDLAGRPRSAHSVDAVLDLVKNALWKSQDFFLSSSQPIDETEKVIRNADDLLKELSQFRTWAGSLGIADETLRDWGLTDNFVPDIDACVRSMAAGLGST